MKYLVVSTNTKDVSPFIAAEAQRIAELRAVGTITAIWLKSDFSGAVLIVECADETEATATLNTLPIVINDATAFVLTEIIDPPSVHAGSA
jgi:muconolactone delta-isomerase